MTRGDVALASGLGVVALWLGTPGWLSGGLVVMAAVALALRRAYPVVSVAVTGLSVVLLPAFGYELSVVPWATWIALYSCMAFGSMRERVTGVLFAAAGVAGYLIATPEKLDPLLIAGVAMSTVLAALAGEAVRTRRAYVSEMEERHRALEKTVLLEERARLARELHDAVGHAVNVMVMQAGVASRVYDSNPDYGREALQSIAATGRDALTELDTLLGLLGPSLEPGPLLTELPVMVQRICDTGRSVEAKVNGDVAIVPQRISRAGYRIIQEALTNAAKHTRKGRIFVSVDVEPSSIVLQVRDEGGECAPVMAGRGLVNMAERSRMASGSFEAGPAAGGFLVRSELPFQELGTR